MSQLVSSAATRGSGGDEIGVCEEVETAGAGRIAKRDEPGIPLRSDLRLQTSDRDIELFGRCPVHLCERRVPGPLVHIGRGIERIQRGADREARPACVRAHGELLARPSEGTEGPR